jgi:hypothetical protein
VSSADAALSTLSGCSSAMAAYPSTKTTIIKIEKMSIDVSFLWFENDLQNKRNWSGDLVEN